MPEPIRDPKRGDNIRAWAIAVTRELRRLTTLLAVDGSGGLETVGGTLRARGTGPTLEWVHYPAGGVPAKSGSTPGSATITHYNWNGTALTLSSRTETIRNGYPAAVTAATGGKDGWAVRWKGTLWVVTEACS